MVISMKEYVYKRKNLHVTVVFEKESRSVTHTVLHVNTRFLIFLFIPPLARTAPRFLRRSITSAAMGTTRACETSRSRSHERERTLKREIDGRDRVAEKGNRSVRIGEPSSYSILPLDSARLTMEGGRKHVCPRLNCVSDNDWKDRFSTQSKREYNALRISPK